MSNQNINGYEIERNSIGDDDYFDIDWLDGAVYKTAKVKGSVVKALASGVNIYNADGNLTGDRVLDGDDFALAFNQLRKFTMNVNPAPIGTTGVEFNVFPTGALMRFRDATTNEIRLEIMQDGSIRFNEEYKFPLLDGSAGQVLQTDGSGNLSFATMSVGDMTKATYDPNNDGVVLSSEKLMVSCINKTGALVPKGTIVFLNTSSSSGTHPEIVLASNINEFASSKTIGAIYQDLPNNAVGFIVTHGEVDNLDTTAYTIGTRLWLGTTAGSVTTTPPVAPFHAVFIGIVTRSQNVNGRILYSIQNGFEINELHDVLITSPLDGQTLSYDSTLQIWKNVSQSSPTQTDLDPVINLLNTPPTIPIVGDRYRIGTSPTSTWIGQNNNIAEWNGSSWIFTIPVVDNLVYQTATATTFRFNGISWLQWAGSPILQNGNSFGAVMRIGTNDALNVIIKRAGIDVFVHGASSFSQRGANTGIYGTFNLASVTSAQTWNLPNASGTIALTSQIPSIPFIPETNAGEIRRGFSAVNGSTTQNNYGGLTPTNTGSLIAVAMNVADLTPYPKLRLLTNTGSTNSVVGVHFGNSSVVHKIGFGFRFVGTYSITDRAAGGTEWFVPNARHFCGMASVGTILGISSTISVASQTGIIGIGSDPTDVNLQLFFNGSGTMAKIDLGSGFPANKSGAVTNYESYELQLFNEFGSQDVLYKVTKLSSGLVTTGTLTNNMPTGFIAPQIVRTSGSTSQNVSLDILSLTAYTPN